MGLDGQGREIRGQEGQGHIGSLAATTAMTINLVICGRTILHRALPTVGLVEKAKGELRPNYGKLNFTVVLVAARIIFNQSVLAV